MKTSRRVYTRNSTVHVCFEGATFGPGRAETAVSLARAVKVAQVDRGHLEVKQGKVAEVWRRVKVPVHPRGG